MKIKCRGYSGKLVSLEATENAVRKSNGDVIREIAWYDIEILADDGAIVRLDRVKESEMQVTE